MLLLLPLSLPQLLMLRLLRLLPLSQLLLPQSCFDLSYTSEAGLAAKEEGSRGK